MERSWKRLGPGAASGRLRLYFVFFLSGLGDPSKIQIPFRALFHWKMEMEKRGGCMEIWDHDNMVGTRGCMVCTFLKARAATLHAFRECCTGMEGTTTSRGAKAPHGLYLYFFCRVSETRVKYKFHSGHFSIGKWKWKNGGGAWKFGTMTTWSALEVVWSATFLNQS